MQMKILKLAVPIAIALLTGVPGSAQIRLGVELPSVHIRIAPEAPPPIRMERRMPRPDRGHVWIAGYWDRQGDRWDWSPGRWERPGRHGSRWIRPQYRQEHGATRYEPGHWSHQRVEEHEEYSRWRKDHRRKHR